MNARSPEEVDLLIEHGATLNHLNKEGHTAIAFASS